MDPDQMRGTKDNQDEEATTLVPTKLQVLNLSSPGEAPRAMVAVDREVDLVEWTGLL